MLDEIIFFDDFPCILLDSYITQNDTDVVGNHQFKVICRNTILWLYIDVFDLDEKLQIETKNQEVIKNYWKKYYL